MSIKKYFVSKDTTITNAFGSNLFTRGTGSNMGKSDILEVFSIYGQASTSSIEKTRMLLQFPVNRIEADRNSGILPGSGSVSFYLNLYNAVHPFTLPEDYTLVVHAVSRSWDEGYGLDMEEYSDLGYANWIAASSSSSGVVNWTTEGGDFHTEGYVAGATMPFYSIPMQSDEDISLDITSMVEEWLAGTKENYGLGIFLTSCQENGSLLRSFYTKKFFASGSEFFFKRPVIEARWDSSRRDDQGTFYRSSSVATAQDNLNTLYLYNKIRGQYTNIPSISNNKILLSVYQELGGNKVSLPVGGNVLENNDYNVTGGLLSTGIYTASFAYTGTAGTIYPVWHSGSVEFYTGSAVTVKSFSSNDYSEIDDFVINIINLKSSYKKIENPTLRLYTRLKNWTPTIYTRASTRIEPKIVEDIFYRVYRVIDGKEVVAYGTGSTNHTKLSYDVSGSYFDFDMSLLERGYMYGFTFLFNIGGNYEERSETFKFRVD